MTVKLQSEVFRKEEKYKDLVYQQLDAMVEYADGDECHNIPGIVQNQYSPIIKRDDFKKLNELYEYAYGNGINDLFEENSQYELIISYSRDALNVELEKIFHLLSNYLIVVLYFFCLNLKYAILIFYYLYHFVFFQVQHLMHHENN